MTYLERLDIHPMVQSFFDPYLLITGNTIKFYYNNDFEHVSQDFHHVPITSSLWIAGEPEYATDIFICGSAVDAICFLNLKHKRYYNLTNLCFLSTGPKPYPNNLFAEILYKNMPKKKLHFIFSNDNLGAIYDLKLASFIRNKPIKIRHDSASFLIEFENQHYNIEKLSINALEKASGYNFRIRTHKPKNSLTYHEQLRQRHHP